MSSYKEAYQKHLNQVTRVKVLNDTEITLPPKTVQFITLSSKRCKLSGPNRWPMSSKELALGANRTLRGQRQVDLWEFEASQC